MDLILIFIVYLRGLVLLTFFVPGAARRSIRIDHSANDAQQQHNTLTKALEVSAEAREALLPGGFGTALFRRWSPQAGALLAAHELGPQLHAPHGQPLSMRYVGQGSRLPPQRSPVLEQYGGRVGHLEPHRAAPWLHARPRHPAVALHAARNLKEDHSPEAATPGPAASDSDADPVNTYAGGSKATEPLRRALDSLGPVGYLTAAPAQRKKIDALLRQLLRPAESLDGDWELVYTDAPDITGLANSGPLFEVSRIGQSFNADAGTVENIIEFVPREWLPGRGDGDRLQNRVLLDYDVEPVQGRDITAKLTGLKIIPKNSPKQMAGFSLPDAPPLNLQGPLSVPFGNLECVYNDGDLRVFRTRQGYWIVAKRLPQDDGWDA